MAGSRQLLEALRDHGLPQTLEELDLSESSLDSDSVEFFLEHKELFGKLKRLVFEDTLMGPDDVAKLADLGPQIAHSQGSGVRYRYLVGME